MCQRPERFEKILNELDDEHDENKELIEFYEGRLSILRTCRVAANQYLLIRKIAIRIDQNEEFDYDWLKYVTAMGITDDYKLAAIKASAKAHKDLPVFVAMFTYLKSSGSFGDIINSLLINQRYDVLRIIKPEVKEMLESIPKETKVKRIISFESKPFTNLFETEEMLTSSSQLSEDENTAPILSTLSLNNNISEEHCTVKKSPVSIPEDRKCEYNSLQQHSVNAYSAQQIHNLPKPNERTSEGNSNEKLQIPSAPAEERLSVLIQHTEYEQDIARELSAKLKQEGMMVTMLSDLDELIPIDGAGALYTMFQEVDFIVPVVSERLLKQIRPQDYDRYLESPYAVNNRNLYQLITNEYRNDRCMNFRVRPVVVPQMNRRLLVKDVILSFSFRLWNEVPKLIKILKESKQLNAQNLVH